LRPAPIFNRERVSLFRIFKEMKKTNFRKYAKRTIWVIGSIYLLICILVLSFQEKLLFHPEAVPKTEQYVYTHEFTETNYQVEKGVELNTLLFKSDTTSEKRKLVFYIHGNAENLTTAGGVASTYLNQGYDFFVYDFRGYGKSGGKIDTESALFADAQILYSNLLRDYEEADVTIVGYSIGTGIAAWLAAKNSPSKLILQAPYYSMKDMMRTKYPFLPSFLLRYPLETNERVKEVKCPIYIFHGDQDEAIPYSSSVKLKKVVKTIDLTKLEGLGHTGFMKNPDYQSKIREILSN
jgi:pimeloyl-ACP methyl ester carboxylesterase